MNNWTRKRKARGFTLVELLIVIVIIGILAGSMLLVFGSATDKAKATRIVSDMRNIKAAALMYYADNNAWPIDSGTTTLTTSGDIESLSSYMDRNDVNSNPDASYDIYGDGGSGLFVRAEVTGDGIKKRLDLMEDESGLTISDDYYLMQLTN